MDPRLMEFEMSGSRGWSCVCLKQNRSAGLELHGPRPDVRGVELNSGWHGGTQEEGMEDEEKQKHMQKELRR